TRRDAQAEPRALSGDVIELGETLQRRTAETVGDDDEVRRDVVEDSIGAMERDAPRRLFAHSGCRVERFDDRFHAREEFDPRTRGRRGKRVDAELLEEPIAVDGMI